MNEVGVQINVDWRMLLHTFRKVEGALRKSYVRLQHYVVDARTFSQICIIATLYFFFSLFANNC